MQSEFKLYITFLFLITRDVFPNKIEMMHSGLATYAIQIQLKQEEVNDDTHGFS